MDLDTLRSLGVTHVLNAAHHTKGVNTDAQYYKDLHIAYCGFKIFDDPTFDISKFFAPAIRFINKALRTPGDLYKHKFIDCTFVNSTFLDQKEGCHLDFEEDSDFLIYLVSFLGSLSVLPGNIVSALLMDKIGRIKMIGKVLVHCFKGKSRSATLVLAYLMIFENLSLVEAIYIVSSRRYIHPNDGFLTQLRILDRKLEERRRTAQHPDKH